MDFSQGVLYGRINKQNNKPRLDQIEEWNQSNINSWSIAKIKYFKK